MAIRASHRIFCTALGLALTLGAQAETGSETHSAAWWDPADGGWGVYTMDQGNLLAPYWTTYDEDGKSTWFMGLALPQENGSYAGRLYRHTGTPYPLIAGQRAGTPGVDAGEVTLEFDTDPRKLKLTHTLDGHTSSRTVTRFNFDGKDVVCKAGPMSRVDATNYTDAWWEPATSGWGLNIMHLDEKLYGQWYTYEAPNRAVFMTLGLARQLDGSYAGGIYRQNDGGRPYKSNSSVPSQPGSQEVGQATLRFVDGEHAEFDWEIDGEQGHHLIQRLQAGTLANHCATVDYPDPDDGAPGEGELCFPEYAIGDSRTLRSIQTSDGVTDAPYEFTETVRESASFNGHSGFRQVLTHSAYAGDGSYAYNYVGNDGGFILSFGAEALDPDTKQVITTSRNDPASVRTPRHFTPGETVAMSYGVNSTGSGVSVRTDLDLTFRLVGKESVTVPAGTFTACKFEQTQDIRSNPAGATLHVQKNGFVWTHPVFGMVKQEFQGVSTVSMMGFGTTTEIEEMQELLEATMAGEHRP